MPPNVRVGQPGSVVKPGQPVPGRPGHYYETGQYAPSPISLTLLKLQEMDHAGLLPETGLDIFNKNGEIDQDKLESLNLKSETDKYMIEAHSPDLPAFAFVGLASVFHNIDQSIFRYLDMSYLDWVADVQTPAGGALSEQIAKFSEVTDVTSRNLITGYSRDHNGFKFAVYQPFFVYLSIPVVPAVRNISTGLSVAAVSALRTLGHMIFEKIQLTDKKLFYETLDQLGWIHKSSMKRDESSEYVGAGTEIGRPRGSSWLRNKHMKPVSSTATLSPRETFSEAFMYYYVHRMFLEGKDKVYSAYFNHLVEDYMERV